MTKTIEKVQKTTTTSNEERLNQLKQLFPECLTEGEVDAVKVMELLNICKEGADVREEPYRFAWTGKRDAIRILNIPTEATLKPCRDESLHFKPPKTSLLREIILRSSSFSISLTLAASKLSTSIHLTTLVTTSSIPTTTQSH